MNIVSLTILGALLVIAGASYHQSSFIASANLHGQVAEPSNFSDSDLHHLILHNLGLLSNQEISESSEKVVNKYGEPTFVKKTLLNYLFLIETSSDTNSQDFIPEGTANHQAVKFDICLKNETCIIDLLYNRNSEKSLANQFENIHGVSAHKGIHYYSSDANITQMLKDVSFSPKSNKQGNVQIIENRSGRALTPKQSLSKCINDIVRGEFAIDVDTAVVYHTKNQTKSTFQQDLFQAFAEEMCSIVSMSKLIRKDTTPSLVTFYIKSIGKLQSSLAAGPHRDVAYSIWNMSYNTVRKNLLSRFSEDEVTGQVILLNHNNTIAHMSKNGGRSVRMLEETTVTDILSVTTLLTKQQIVYRVFGVSFVIVLALILVAMSSIEVQKDTLVYSKFLSAEPRR